MTLRVTHDYISTVPDSGDSTIVQPTNWNNDHTVTGVLPSTQVATDFSSISISSVGQKLYVYISGNEFPPTPASSRVFLQFVGNESSQSMPWEFDTFGGAMSFIFRRANAPSSAPTAVVTGNSIMNFTARAYDGTAYSADGEGTAWEVRAAENWAPGAHGAHHVWRIVPIGSTDTQEVMYLGKGLNVSHNADFDPAYGVINAGVGFQVGSTLASSGQVLRGNATNFVPATLAITDLSGTALISQQQVSASITFTTSNTDFPVSIPLPTGYSRYALITARISGASAPALGSATLGLFSSTGGGGTSIIALTAITITSTAEDTVNNMMALTPSNVTTQTHNQGTLYFRVGAASTSPVTATATLTFVPVS